MAYIIKARLTVAAVDYYKNVTEYSPLPQIATNIVLCNTSATAANVTLSFTKLDGEITTGFILFETPIPAKGFLELKDRVVGVDTLIKAYASVDNVVVFSCDVLNDDGEYYIPV